MLLDYNYMWKRINENYDIHDHPKLSRFLVQDRNEWQDFIDIVSQSPIRYGLEIGTNAGGTFYALCCISESDATLISIDFTNGPYINCDKKEMIFKNEFPKEGQHLHIIHNDSTKEITIEQVSDILKEDKLDYLFIDGDHSYDGVKQDYFNYKDFVRKDGIIAFHDIKGDANSGSCKFWNELKNHNKCKEISYSEESMGIGIIWKQDETNTI